LTVLEIIFIEDYDVIRILDIFISRSFDPTFTLFNMYKFIVFLTNPVKPSVIIMNKKDTSRSLCLMLFVGGASFIVVEVRQLLIHLMF